MNLPKITLVGLGNMGEALLSGILSTGLIGKGDIVGVESYVDRAVEISTKYGIRVVSEVGEGCAGAEVVLLAVKPGDAETALREIAKTKAATIISVCAGLTTSWFKERAGAVSSIVRVMPNTPALVGEGATAYVMAGGSSEKAAIWTEAIFGAVGKVYRVKDEALMDAVTGLSGSGPAYVFLFIEALADAGVAAGLPRDVARELALQTVKGASTMAQESDDHTSVLKDRVCSPGGTTIEGVRVLEEKGLRSAMIEAVLAATRRSRELGGN